MKYVSTLVFFICSFFISTAQLRVAVVAGGHQSSVIEENNLPDWNNLKGLYSERFGIHGGLLADLPFSSKSHFSFQPGVVFYQKGRKFSQRFDTTVSSVLQLNKEEFINYIDIPLNLVYKINLGKKVKFILGGGPYASVFFNGKLNLETISVDRSNSSIKLVYKQEENNDPGVGKGPDKYLVLDYGLNGLAGFEFGRLFITANYSRGFDDFFNPALYNATSYKHQVIGGTIGLYLGKPLNIEKKPKDKDKDGIADEKDNCPDEAGSLITNGCPDKDADGIADKDDKCPEVAGIVKNNGCPILDRDNDGVNDNEDKCPDQIGSKKYFGCPVPDSDKDGINDDEDKCPLIVGLGRYEGCPIPDTDGDGVNDEKDKCPDVKGTKERNGCPVEEIKKEIIEKINYAAKRIQFQTAKAVLLPASILILDDVATILKENPELNVLIEGHTSNDGNFESNMKLSNDRATKVKNYLQSKGIEFNRLTAKGFGPTQPLNNNKTPAERSLNRRVEMKLSN